jgi:sulfopyruvate decarboxylase subunit alpha
LSEHASPKAKENSLAFLEQVRRRGYGFFSGVPCSLLGGLFTELEHDRDLDYIPAVREDIAVGLAAGAHLAGKKAVVLMQNSGLGVCYNALASLNEIYEIPALLVVSWRGEGGKDAPEHIRMGEVMTKIFEELEIPFEIADPAKLSDQLASLDAKLEERRRPVALIAQKGVFA